VNVHEWSLEVVAGLDGPQPTRPRAAEAIRHVQGCPACRPVAARLSDVDRLAARAASELTPWDRPSWEAALRAAVGSSSPATRSGEVPAPPETWPHGSTPAAAPAGGGSLQRHRAPLLGPRSGQAPLGPAAAPPDPGAAPVRRRRRARRLLPAAAAILVTLALVAPAVWLRTVETHRLPAATQPSVTSQPSATSGPPTTDGPLPSRQPAPEAVAREWLLALNRHDLDTMWRLLSPSVRRATGGQVGARKAFSVHQGGVLIPGPVAPGVRYSAVDLPTTDGKRRWVVFLTRPDGERTGVAISVVTEDGQSYVDEHPVETTGIQFLIEDTDGPEPGASYGWRFIPYQGVDLATDAIREAWLVIDNRPIRADLERAPASGDFRAGCCLRAWVEDVGEISRGRHQYALVSIDRHGRMQVEAERFLIR
jgi:hypothetical protein